MSKTKLTVEDVAWLESRLSDAVCAGPIQPRREFIDRAKSQLLESPWPHPPSRLRASGWRTVSLWSALMLILSAIFASVWYLRQRAQSSRPAQSPQPAQPNPDQN